MVLAFLDNLFITQIRTEPVYVISVLVTVVVSITLHELGHGVAAIWQGDQTPRVSGHMTLNPLVHMGTFSFVMLLLVGIAWGSMPVDPTRFRSRHGDAIVSAAGPAVNLLLAVLGLTVLGLWLRFGGGPVSETGANFAFFLVIFGQVNFVLLLLNLIPLPPLDGSHVLASFSGPFRRFMADPNNQGMFTVVFIAIFLGASKLWEAADWLTAHWVAFVVS